MVRGCSALLALVLYPAAVQAATPQDLVKLINAYRAAPVRCAGQPAPAVSALAPHRALSAVRIRPGEMLAWALEQQGYEAEHVEAVSISGADDAASALDTAVQKYCSTLRAPGFRHLGVARNGNAWQIVLAQPAPPKKPPPPPLPDMAALGPAVLAAVNSARATPRMCGNVAYEPAAPLTLDAQLGKAALAHSRDMAFNGYFSHESPAGERVAARARAAGYPFASIGENIAYGQRTVEDVMASWLASPGHCANIMEPSHRAMGIAYATDTIRARPYWTQVLARPR